VLLIRYDIVASAESPETREDVPCRRRPAARTGGLNGCAGLTGRGGNAWLGQVEINEFIAIKIFHFSAQSFTQNYMQNNFSEYHPCTAFNQRHVICNCTVRGSPCTHLLCYALP